MNPKGLTTKQAEEKLKLYGKNTVNTKKNKGLANNIISTLKEPVFGFLIICSFICFFTGEFKDGIVMLFFVCAVTATEIFQNRRTDKSLKSLNSLAPDTAVVLRDGIEKKIKTENIVPDDIVIINPDTKIAADGLITECSSLFTDESSLTGEADFCQKQPIDNEDYNSNYCRNNKCYAGTFAVSGHGKMQVTATGENTEYGKTVKAAMSALPSKSPLQQNINRLVKRCTAIALICCVITFILTFITDTSTDLSQKLAGSVLSGISLAMGTIPEELPVVLTVFFSMGTLRLTKNNATIRNISSVETLGCVSVICIDKTGTLTCKDSLSGEETLKSGAKEFINKCKNAGIRVIMLTGDNVKAAESIAQQAGISTENICKGINESGSGLDDFKKQVFSASVFSEITPEQKTMVIKALQASGETVAMLGDGINDTAALKCADVGIAMGLGGSSNAKDVADIVLTNDRLSTVTKTIKDGRRIFRNIQKSVCYLITIHLPIILSALFSPVLNLQATSIFLLPTGIALTEMLIDPTCSIVFESLPANADIMNLPPRGKYENILSKKMLLSSVLQGVVLFVFSFIPYVVMVKANLCNTNTARSFGMSVIMLSNIFLILSNLDFGKSFTKTLSKITHNKTCAIFILFNMALCITVIYSPLNTILNLESLSFSEFALSLAFAFFSFLISEKLASITRSKKAKY
ncbi:MAG: cation-translocating P-type ATPase [Clostridia bacterium]|nr:cation-translocating P-type ATPase [Clostridia bacterium]